MSNVPRTRLFDLLRPALGGGAPTTVSSAVRPHRPEAGRSDLASQERGGFASPPTLAIHAPAGWGKSSLLDAAARSDLRLVPVSLGLTEGHPSLFVDALAQGLRKAFPGAAVGAVRAAAGLRAGEDPIAVFERIREALAVDALVIGFDEAEQLPRGEAWEIVKAMCGPRPAALRVVLTARVPQPELLASPDLVLGPPDLAMTVGEIEQVILDELATSPLVPPVPPAQHRALARRVALETGGWPALVAARIRASRALTVPRAELGRIFAPIVEESLKHERSEARYVLQVASVVSAFTRPFVQALVSGDVPGSPENRRRLIRLEPAAIARALDDLVRSALVAEAPGDPQVLTPLAGVRLVLSERLREKDPAGWLEANRRAGELSIARDRNPGPELVDLFAASGERERLVEILSRHAPRLELELADRGDDERILAWVAAFDEDPSPPFWIDILAGLALARRGQVDEARDRLDRGREKLAFEKRDIVLWRWQPRLSEAQALTARSRGDYVDARSFLQRGLDQVAQANRRGLAQGEAQGELEALELRMTVLLARITRESATWDKAREIFGAARTLLLRQRSRSQELSKNQQATLVEIELYTLLMAASAGDRDALGELVAARSIFAPVAQVLVGLAATGDVARALEELRALAIRPTGESPAESHPAPSAPASAVVANLIIARYSPSAEEVQVALDAVLASADPVAELIHAEAELRKRRVSPHHLEGWTQALALEMAAPGPGRALDVARDAYRRALARFDEIRLWLATAAAAARRVDDGDGDVEAVVKAVDAIIELSQAGGFAIPWSYAGRGEVDPERRIRTLWIAGLRNGSERSREVCKAELERLGVDTRAVTGPKDRPRPISGISRRPMASPGAPFALHTRTSSQGLTGSEYQQLIASKAPGAFVVCVPDQLVLNFGRVVPLGQKRVMMPLLLHLLRNPDAAFSMLELAREVWDSPELTPTVQTKVKVAISRLRALLGKNRNYITTTRKHEGGESVVAYQIAPQLQFQIVEQSA